MMMSRWIYLLIGDDQTGKTFFQKRVIYHLCGLNYKRLDRNLIFNIVHPCAPGKLRTLFTINRSYQETKDEYVDVQGYFASFFKDADICVLSSHSHSPCINDIKEMIEQGRRRKYNLGAIFWSNCDNCDTEDISLLNWDERFWMENPVTDNKDQWQQQIDDLARRFADILIARSYFQ